jgi:hypothetical protein
MNLDTMTDEEAYESILLLATLLDKFAATIHPPAGAIR